MTCIITGCALVDDNEGKVVWGDLHRVGGAWVFNAVLGPSGEAAWQYDTPVPDVTRQLVINRPTGEGSYFERRGVIIIAGGWAWPNKAALDYVKEPIV